MTLTNVYSQNQQNAATTTRFRFIKVLQSIYLGNVYFVCFIPLFFLLKTKWSEMRTNAQRDCCFIWFFSAWKSYNFEVIFNRRHIYMYIHKYIKHHVYVNKRESKTSVIRENRRKRGSAREENANLIKLYTFDNSLIFRCKWRLYAMHSAKW